jgi:hypothetical protein
MADVTEIVAHLVVGAASVLSAIGVSRALIAAAQAAAAKAVETTIRLEERADDLERRATDAERLLAEERGQRHALQRELASYFKEQAQLWTENARVMGKLDERTRLSMKE